MREWLNSDEGVETAIRLANHIVKKYQGHNWYSTRDARLLQPEILSITYICMANVIDKYDPERGTIKTFLWSVVPREVLKAVKEDRPYYDDIEDIGVAHETYTQENIDAKIDDLIKTLPQPRRDRFKMHLQGYTYKEIMQVHNISKSMVYKDIALAQEQLRKELQYD